MLLKGAVKTLMKFYISSSQVETKAEKKQL